MPKSYAAYRTGWIFLAITFVFIGLVLGQAEPPIKGTVVNRDGQFIVGAAVLGGMGPCCPYKREQATTDEKGEFRLDHPAAVIRLFKEDFEPKSFVVKPGASMMRVVMEDSANDMMVPVCAHSSRDQSRLVGARRIRFAVPEREVQMAGGQPDVDYVLYVIKPTNGKSSLELWFGPYALSSDPDDEQFVNSTDFAQQNVVTPDGVVGINSWGRLKSGGNWRRTAVFGEGGAIYRQATADETKLFDRIIDSMCFVPYARR